MNVHLDLKDKRILYELDVNARRSNAEIAKYVELSKDSVGYRINRLEELGVIRGFRAVIDSARLGYLFYRVYFNLMDMPPTKLRDLLEFLRKRKEVWWIARADGAWNFIFAVWAKSNKEFSELYHEIGVRFKENIKESRICPILSYKNISRKYLTGLRQRPVVTSVGDGERIDFDESDLRILKFLAENARAPLIEMAHKLKVDSMTVYHRIKKLERNGVIQGYKVDLDSGQLGRDFYSVKINLREVSRVKEIKEFILTLPEVTATTEAIGSYDLEFDLEVENSKRYFKILEELETKFSFIREVAYFRVLDNHKILYLPEI